MTPVFRVGENSSWQRISPDDLETNMNDKNLEVFMKFIFRNT
jgi:hypothetical protein